MYTQYQNLICFVRIQNSQVRISILKQIQKYQLYRNIFESLSSIRTKEKKVLKNLTDVSLQTSISVDIPWNIVWNSEYLSNFDYLSSTKVQPFLIFNPIDLYFIDACFL